MLVRDEETVELRETFTSLQQEVEAKTKKLKKVKDAQILYLRQKPRKESCVHKCTYMLIYTRTKWTQQENKDLQIYFYTHTHT